MNELLIYNYSGTFLFLKFYPISGLFNSKKFGNNDSTEYSIYSKLYIPNVPQSGAFRKGGGPPLKTIVGLDGYALNTLGYPGFYEFDNLTSCEFSVDFSHSGAQDGLIGFGIYRLEIYNSNLELVFDPITIDWSDFNYISSNYLGKADLLIFIRGLESSDIRYLWTGDAIGPPSEEVALFGNIPYPCPSPGYIQLDKQYYIYENNQWSGYNVPYVTIPKSHGNSLTNLYSLIYPADGRALPNPYTIPQHLNAGYLVGNLTIDTPISTEDTLLENPTNITISPGSKLIIDWYKTFNMIPSISPANGSNHLTIQDSAYLILKPYSKVTVGSRNKVTLKNKGFIGLAVHSELEFLAGSQFCNNGGRIAGNGQLTFAAGYHYVCNELENFNLKDSAKLVLSDSAVLEIPDSTILHFTGKQSGLVMNPHSKLKMGIGSKIIFDSSASIYADGAEFSSVDSLEKWEGIFLYDSDADTIKNCTFSNAKTALTIINDPDDAESVYKNRIITDNTFNIPSGGTYIGIYGENNYRILLKKNDFNMPVYYPSGSPVQLLYAGVYLKNSSSVQPDSGDVETNQETNYSLNIEGNSFSNGCASLILANYTQAICLI